MTYYGKHDAWNKSAGNKNYFPYKSVSENFVEKISSWCNKNSELSQSCKKYLFLSEK